MYVHKEKSYIYVYIPKYTCTFKEISLSSPSSSLSSLLLSLSSLSSPSSSSSSLSPSSYRYYHHHHHHHYYHHHHHNRYHHHNITIIIIILTITIIIFRFDTYLQRIQELSIESTYAIAVLNLGQAAMFCVGLTSSLLIALNRVQRGTMSVGDLVAVNSMLLQVSLCKFVYMYVYIYTCIRTCICMSIYVCIYV
jgi:hypothetical protein